MKLRYRSLGAMLIGTTLLLPASPALAAKRGSAPVTVDAWISSGGARTGVGIISRTGEGEILASSVTAPVTVIYDIGAAVSGGSTTVTFFGGGGSPDFVVQYYATDGTNVTLAVTGRGYIVRKVADGAVVHLRMVVQVRPSAAGHSGNLAVLASTSSGGDMVVGNLKVS